MKKKLIGVLIIFSLLILISATSVYSSKNSVSNSIQTTNFTPNDQQLKTAENKVIGSFPNNANGLHLHRSVQSMLESDSAQFEIDPSSLTIKSVRFNNVDMVGKKRNISSQVAHEKAIQFIKNQFPDFDLTKFVEETAFNSNYILKLNEIDKATGTKLLNSITVIVNQETGEIAMAMFNLNYPEIPSQVSINKENAKQMADNKINTVFNNGKLEWSSPTLEQRLLNGKAVTGWIFIYKSDKHSAGIMVDSNSGEVIVQQAY